MFYNNINSLKQVDIAKYVSAYGNNISEFPFTDCSVILIYFHCNGWPISRGFDGHDRFYT